MHVVVDRKLVRHHPGTASQGEPDAGPHVGLMEQGSPKPLRPRAAVQGYLPARTRDHRKVRAPPSRQEKLEIPATQLSAITARIGVQIIGRPNKREPRVGL